jgi:pimeloyl-ACP methyl ester carboxylesterase
MSDYANWYTPCREAMVSVNFISDSGHFVQEEQPEQVATYLIEHWRICTPEHGSE